MDRTTATVRFNRIETPGVCRLGVAWDAKARGARAARFIMLGLPEDHEQTIPRPFSISDVWTDEDGTVITEFLFKRVGKVTRRMATLRPGDEVVIDWFPKKELPPSVKRWFGSTGTINCNGVTPDGDLGGCTTTSGLAFKIPSRVGDSPIIGAGLYVDNDHGAAGSTGRGEANIITCGSFSVVEGIRRGMHPKDACVYAAKNVIRMTKAKHLVGEDGKPNFNVKWYAVDKQGRYGGGGAIKPGGKYAVCDENGPRLEDLAHP